MKTQIKKYIRISLTGLLLTAAFLLYENYLPPAKLIHLKIYDLLNRIEYRLRKLPPGINDIIIIGIDNETVSKMPHRWPYPRSIFANVIKNLTLARAKAIAFDFVFLGRTEEAEDKALESALAGNDKIILACTVDDNNSLNIRSLRSLSRAVPSGIVTKLQDSDGVIRRNLTYLVSDEIPPKGFLSWEMTILKTVEGMDVTPVKGNERYISIKNDKREKWMIPVDPYNKSFMINFRAHTVDFKRVSFYDAYKGNFDPNIIKDKIALVGFVSSLLGDIHNTPIGWIPGITLNANSFLTLYTRTFIDKVPSVIVWFLTIIGVMLSIMAVLFFDTGRASAFIGAEILIFFVISYILLTMGWTWDYFAFPFSVALFPVLSKKIYSLIWQRKKFYWT